MMPISLCYSPSSLLLPPSSTTNKINNMEEKKNIQLPDNAFRELKEGEQYEPVMSPMKQYAEVNGWSVTWGILMAVLFSAAAAYLGLKVGQVTP